jgi:glutamine amidotransferase-like uncharacterized protein
MSACQQPAIRLVEYVRAGGAYLGLCAGAYYACSRVEFEPGGPLEVVGNRELGFFPGVAAGAAYAGEHPGGMRHALPARNVAVAAYALVIITDAKHLAAAVRVTAPCTSGSILQC